MAEDGTTETTPTRKGTTNVPGFGQVKTKTAVTVGAAAVVGVVLYARMRSKAQATTAGPGTGSVTDPGGNVCTPDQINPQTGYCLGSAQDTSAMSEQSAINAAQGGSFYTGEPFVSGQQPGTGAPVGSPGFFANNAEWAQAVYTALGSTGTDSMAQAVSTYLSGGVLTANQLGLVDEAIAVEGLPPVAGPTGYPPSINTGTGSGSGTTPPPTNVTVPNVVGMKAGDAHNAIVAAGLVPTDPHAAKGEYLWIVASTSPPGGTSVAQHSKVQINATKPTTVPGGVNPGGPNLGQTYVVRRGDTLSGIASKFKYPGGWQALYQANRGVIGSNPNMIKPGEVLKV